MEQKLRELLKKMIHGLQQQVEEKVPESGKFDVVYEREEVSEMHIGLSHLILKVRSAKYEEIPHTRFLELGAMNYPSPYGAESILGCGSTQEIKEKLHEERLLDKLMEKVPKLAEDIDYEERHPYG
jgi:hypothetical protein